MQIKLFTVPVGDTTDAVQEVNNFLRGNKILEVEHRLISNDYGAFWCFCIKYIERFVAETGQDGGIKKVDYKKVLDEPTFAKFSRLREIRKKVAGEEGISAFIIFTDEELAELAKLPEITEKSMIKIKGIGEKKVERYSKYFIENKDNEKKGGLFD